MQYGDFLDRLKSHSMAGTQIAQQLERLVSSTVEPHFISQQKDSDRLEGIFFAIYTNMFVHATYLIDDMDPQITRCTIQCIRLSNFDQVDVVLGDLEDMHLNSVIYSFRANDHKYSININGHWDQTVEEVTEFVRHFRSHILING